MTEFGALFVSCVIITPNSQADPNLVVCSAPARIHHVAWANPAVSSIEYETTTVAGAKPGDHIAFEWDDVVHDVWLIPQEAPDPCNTTGS
jgi:plastocyanin